MNIAKELDEMGHKAGGDGRAILTVQPEDIGYGEYNSTGKMRRVTKVTLYVSLSRGRSISIDKRFAEHRGIEDVIREGWELVNRECDGEELCDLRRKLSEIHQLSACPA